MKKFLTSITISLALIVGCSAQEPPPVPEDEVGIVEVLPSKYPASWVILNKAGFPLGGKIMIVDVTAENYRYKGAVTAGYEPDFAINQEKSEFYVSETYYERATRGQRHDIITVYDQATLMPKREIKLETRKRFLVSPMTGKFSLINDKKWALVANYTPATSVTIVDIESGDLLNEIDIPGCNLAYPLGDHGFATMCGFGEMISIQLDDQANAISEVVSEPFNDLDNDPHFEKTATVDGIMYMPTFLGNITPIDLTGEAAVVGESWSLVSEEEKAEGWRPGGWQLISSDSRGRLYVLMHDKGFNGSHKDPGKEVWVFDPGTKKRLFRIELQYPTTHIHLTNTDDPLLVTEGGEKGDMLAVYDAYTGEHSHNILIGTSINSMHNVE